MTAAAEALILRLEAPLMAFGGPLVDQHGVTRRLPGLAQLAGLLGNALGFRHGDAARLARLQDRIAFAALLLEEGESLIDYQTVDLGQRHLVDTGWTTRGRREDRAGAASTARGTHIRLRHHRADAAVLVALRLDPPDGAPTLDDLAAALRHPARPLFLGRKPCLPALPVLLGRVAADRLVDAVRQGVALLRREKEHPDADGLGLRAPPTGPVEAEWPAAEGPVDGGHDQVQRLVDRRDWRNQVHGGERLVRTARVALPPEREA